MVQRDETKAWVRAVLTHKRLKPTQLARAIDRAPSTLNRFLNDPSATHELSPDTIERIAKVGGVRPLELPDDGAPRRAGGFTEPEAVPFQPGTDASDKPVDDAVRTMMRSRNSLAPFLLKSPALGSVGYLPGDVLVVDIEERPKPHDVVCAQVYDWVRGHAETVFRLYEPPYLLASTTEVRLLRPFVVDDDAVVVKGVVMWSLRPRRLAELAAA